MERSLKDKKIVFVKNWFFDILPSVNPWSSDVIQFNTVYDASMFEWRLSIVRDFPEPLAVPFGIIRNSNVQLNLEPCISTLSIKSQYSIKCIFGLRVEEPNTTKVLFFSTSHETEEQKVNDDFAGFHIPQDSPFGDNLNRVFSQPCHRLKTCHITVTMIMNKSDYEIQNSFADIPLLSADGKDFRFNTINNKSRQDFTIKTMKDGESYKASREALYICSSYFRQKIMEEGVIKDEIELDTSIEALKTTVIYALTGTFSPPDQLTIELANEILNLSEQLSVMNRRDLKRVIERVASEELQKNKMNLEIVLEWLLTARDMRLSRLENAASAMILQLHFLDLLEKYEDNVENGSRSSLHTRLHHSQRIFRTSAYLKLLHLKRNSQSVHCIEYS
ncbi:unnamed protein product [Auanema sp. JU1783]|nr:unnamed protein product [Auanema sp. JU1783]